MSDNQKIILKIIGLLERYSGSPDKTERIVELLVREGFDEAAIAEIVSFFSQPAPERLMQTEELATPNDMDGMRVFTLYECAAMTESAREHLVRYHYLGLIDSKETEEIINLAMRNETQVDEETMMRIIAMVSGTDIDLSHQSPYF